MDRSTFLSGRSYPAVLAGVVFVVFLPALSAGWVNWDDTTNFLENPHYRGLGPDNLKWMFTNSMGHYMPLTWLTLGFDYVLWGMNPAGYHFTSVLLHAVNAILCYFFIVLLLQRVPRGEIPDPVRRGAALAGSLLYAIHPLRVESVAWVTERRDLVAGFFFFLCLIAYLKALPGEGEGRMRRGWFAASVILFGLSLVSKAVGMTLPLALLVLDAYPLRRLGRRAVIEKIPFALLMIGGILITVVGQETAGAMSGGATYTTAHIMTQPAYKLCFYIGKTFLPVGLSPLYPYRPPSSVFEPKYVLCGIAALGVTALLVRYRRRVPALAATWFAFAFLLGPAVGPLQAGPHFAADRYTYLAALVWSLPVAVLLAGVAPAVRWKASLAVVAVLAVLGALSYRQCRIWRDSEALWSHALSLDRSSPIPFNMRGVARAAQGRHDEAIGDFTASLAVAPGRPMALVNRALSRLKKGDVVGAQEDVTGALQGDARYAKAYQVRGEIHQARGDLEAASRDYSRAIDLDRTLLEAYLGRAIVHGKRGRYREAVEDCNTILLINPFHAGAWVNRGVIRGEMDDLEGAIADYTRALLLSPEIPEAWAGRAMCHVLLGRWPEAVRDFERALAVADPEWPFRKDTMRRLEEARRKVRGP